MGISQLLPFLEKSTRNCHVSEFRGQTVAVDSYCWLHKGARCCAMQLAKGEKTDAYIQYCMKYVKMLLGLDIKPIMVFDGRHLPAKVGTEEKRRESKKQARKQAMEYLRLGQTAEAHRFFCQCVDVTPEMALGLIKECRKIQVDCIVAPYESDAQLAFFNMGGIAECVISEDSDLLLFGCKKVLYKMDISGSGQLVEAEKLNMSMKMRSDQYSFEKFRHMCILSGCDYLDSLPGIGIKKALKFITLTYETDPTIFIDRIPRYLNMKGLIVSPDYKEKFLVADATFKHQIVFNPFRKALEPLNPVEGNEQYCINSGDLFDAKEAYQLALGNLNPLTMERIDDWRPEDNIISDFSIWSPRFKKYRASPPKSKPTSTISKPPDVDIQKLNEDRDKKLEKELEFYKTSGGTMTMSEPTSSTLDTSVSTAVLEEKTSPVLGNNPFIKKKLSKFQSSQPTSGQLVISRFFQKKEFPPTLDSIDGALDLPPEDNQNYVDIIRLQSVLEMEESLPTMAETKEEGSEMPIIECECNLVVEDREIEIPDADPPTLHSVENLELVPGIKRKSGKNGKTDAQMNIRDMIKRMKMNH